MTTRSYVAIAVMLVATACSSSERGPEAVCGPLTIENYPVLLEPATEAALAALESVEETEGIPQGRDWLVAGDTGDELVLLGTPATSNDGYGHLTLKRTGDVWAKTASGSCNLFITMPGLHSATTRLDPAVASDPASTELSLLITERLCASGGALNGRNVEVEVLETPDTVLLLSFIEPVEGMASCPGNDPIAWPVQLDSPLGDRQIFDADSIPHRPRKESADESARATIAVSPLIAPERPWAVAVWDP